jgi:hypothetical protein
MSALWEAWNAFYATAWPAINLVGAVGVTILAGALPAGGLLAFFSIRTP